MTVITLIIVGVILFVIDKVSPLSSGQAAAFLAFGLAAAIFFGGK